MKNTNAMLPDLSQMDTLRSELIDHDAAHLGDDSNVVRAEVWQSWLRCRSLFSSGMESIQGPCLSEPELDTIRHTNFNLVRAAKRHFDRLAERLIDMQCAALYCDANGWILDCWGHPDVISELEVHHIRPGANALESAMGNNALGTAIHTKEPALFMGKEHYLKPWQLWHGAGAPIVTTDDFRIVGACCIVARSPEQAVMSESLADSAAIAISNCLDLEETRQDLVRIHHSLMSQIDYHVVFVDAGGHILDERHPIPLRDSVRTEMLRLTSSGEPRRGEEITLDGQVYLLDVRTLSNHRGQQKGTLGIFRDVTQRKRWESQMRDMEKMATLTSLAAGIAHEIRNPLTAARGFLQLFTERLDSVQDKRFLDLTLHELDRINSLVKDFMALARPEEPHYSEMDLTACIQDIVHFIQPEAALLGVEFTCQAPTAPCFMIADPNQMKQVFLNVVQNALHACKSKGSVSLKLEHSHDKALITISDTGCGMSENQLDRIFQPFFTTKESGTGLGLAITKRIVEEHGGRIQVSSKASFGTTFHLEFNLLQSS